MPDQQALPFVHEARISACAFGLGDPEWQGPHHCRACAAEVERLCQEFAAAVAAGAMDQDGYTPAERKQQSRRRHSVTDASVTA